MKTLVPMTLLTLASWAGAQMSYADDAMLDVGLTAAGGETTVNTTIQDAGGKWWLYMATLSEASDEDAAWVSLGFYKLSGGQDTVSLSFETELLESMPPISLRGVFKQGGEYYQTPAISIGGGLPVFGDCVEFEWGLGGTPVEVGEIVTQTQPWADIFTLSATNTDPFGPDELVVFDSTNPTPGDEDLMTPGPGVGNGTAFGNILVIAQDLVDADNDGLVDKPNDASFGGLTAYDFDGPTDIVSLDIIDIDDAGGEVRYFRDADLIKTVPLAVLGDNSVQNVEGAAGVTRLEVDGGESRAFGKINVFPCPAVINFDESTTGVPLDLPVGLDLTAAAPFANLGLEITATNNWPQKQPKPIIFDTSAITGGDDDLATPGPGVGNDVARRKAVVIAENCDDLDQDGLVDEPDDELAGGSITFEFAIPVRFRSITVLDIDENETAELQIQMQGGGDPLTKAFAPLGDNSVQTITDDIGPTQRIRVVFSGSGAIPELVVCPEPPEDGPVVKQSVDTGTLKTLAKSAVKNKKRKKAKKKAKGAKLALK